MLDPGSMICFDNMGTIALDEGPMPIPVSVNSAAVTADDDGAVLERLEFVQNQYCVSKEITTLPDAMAGLFTIAGGPIVITEIVAFVTTQIGGESCFIGYNINPTAGTDTVFAQTGDAVETNGDVVGTSYIWDGVIATDLTPTTNGAALSGANVGLIVPIGAIELDVDHDGTCAGAIKVFMSYRPLSPDATCVAQ